MVPYGLCFRNSLWGISINKNNCTWYGLYFRSSLFGVKQFSQFLSEAIPICLTWNCISNHIVKLWRAHCTDWIHKIPRNNRNKYKKRKIQKYSNITVVPIYVIKSLLRRHETFRKKYGAAFWEITKKYGFLTSKKKASPRGCFWTKIYKISNLKVDFCPKKSDVTKLENCANLFHLIFKCAKFQKNRRTS